MNKSGIKIMRIWGEIMTDNRKGSDYKVQGSIHTGVSSKKIVRRSFI